MGCANTLNKRFQWKRYVSCTCVILILKKTIAMCECMGGGGGNNYNMLPNVMSTKIERKQFLMLVYFK